MTTQILPIIISDLKWPVVIVVALILFRRQIREVFGRLSNLNITAGNFKLETSLRGRVSPAVFKELRKKPNQFSLGGELRTLTVLHLETHDYAFLTANYSPEAVSNYLHTYLTKMTDVIFQLGGTIDRYEGLSLTAYWGAPIPCEDAPSKACEAALQMQSLINELSPELEAMGHPPLLPLFGVTTAELMVGNFGSEQRANYSLLGDYKDVLKGLVQLNYNFQTNILITENTYSHVANAFKIRLMAEQLQISGKKAPISVYELLGEVNKQEE